jgi:hypothetical protein
MGPGAACCVGLRAQAPGQASDLDPTNRRWLAESPDTSGKCWLQAHLARNPDPAKSAPFQTV